MSSSHKLSAAIAGVLALGLGAASAIAGAPPKPEWKGHEKCAGVAAKGMNDCGTASHDCAGKSTMDKGQDDWVWQPSGTCQKISGGHVMADKMMDKK